jgi:hypothetical protein
MTVILIVKVLAQWICILEVEVKLDRVGVGLDGWRVYDVRPIDS